MHMEHWDEKAIAVVEHAARLANGRGIDSLWILAALYCKHARLGQELDAANGIDDALLQRIVACELDGQPRAPVVFAPEGKRVIEEAMREAEQPPLSVRHLALALSADRLRSNARLQRSGITRERLESFA